MGVALQKTNRKLLDNEDTESTVSSLYGQGRGVQPFFDKGPHSLLWAGLCNACAYATINCIHKLLNHCVIFILHIKYADMNTGQIRATQWTPTGQCKTTNEWHLLYVKGVKFAQC